MTVLLAGVGLVLATVSGLPGLLLRQSPVLGQRLCCAVLAVGASLGIAGAAATLAGVPPGVVELPWSEPGAALSLRLDALAAVFLLPVLGVPAVC